MTAPDPPHAATPRVTETHPMSAPPRESAASLFVRYWLPVLAYIGLIFALSSIHGSSIPGFFPNMDKLEHMLEYSLFGLLAGRAIRFTLGGTSRRLFAAVCTIGLGALVGAMDELYQRRVPGRSSDVVDWIIDIAAVGIAVLLTQLVHTRPLRRRATEGPK
jgi:VanZ family protein